jgi:hypothetical protein
MTRSTLGSCSTADTLSSDMRWVASVLWAGCDVTEGKIAKPSHPRNASFTALPNSRNPRLLVPIAKARAARAALCQYNDGMSQRARIRKAAVGMALWLGIGRLVGDRIDVVPATDPPMLSLLIEELRPLFGRSRLETAVFLGEQGRPNRKPVLQVTDDRGEVLAYVKVGWNPVTKRLVENEADALMSMAAEPPKTFQVPRLLHTAKVGNLQITVVSAFHHRLLRRSSLGADAPFTAVREIAFRGGTEWRALVDSDYARTVLERIAAIDNDVRRESLGSLFDRIMSEAPSTILRFGSWHGDWTPWNMTRGRSGLFVWDWERSARPVPVGFDVLHHTFQFRSQGGRHRVREALSAARALAAPTLLQLGIDESNYDLLIRVYLLELVLRFEEARDLGDPVSRAAIELEAAIGDPVPR